MKKWNKDDIKVTLILLAFPILFLLGIYIRKFSGNFWYGLFFE